MTDIPQEAGSTPMSNELRHATTTKCLRRYIDRYPNANALVVTSADTNRDASEHPRSSRAHTRDEAFPPSPRGTCHLFSPTLDPAFTKADIFDSTKYPPHGRANLLHNSTSTTQLLYDDKETYSHTEAQGTGASNAPPSLRLRARQLAQETLHLGPRAHAYPAGARKKTTHANGRKRVDRSRLPLMTRLLSMSRVFCIVLNQDLRNPGVLKDFEG